MKYILLAFVLIIIKANAQKFIPTEVYKTTLASCKLNGHIKKITSKFYNHSSNDSLLNQWRKFATDSIATATFLIRISEREFDTNGNKLSEMQGHYYFKNEPIYLDDNEDDNPTQKQLSFRLNDSTNMAYKFSKSTHSFIYNKSGKLTQVIQFGLDTVNGYSCDFTYNDKGDLIASKFWGNKNSLMDAYENKYDAKDSLVEVERYDYRNNEFCVEKTNYASNKRKWETNLYLTDGNLYCTKTYEYDNNGSFIFVETHTNRCNFRKSHCKYKVDREGVSAYYTFKNKSGKLITSTKTISKKYDAKGKLIELETLNELTNKISKHVYEYHYDEKGNIIKQISYDKDGNIASQYITEYEYYK